MSAIVDPQVSVIVPARNEEANLRACLESLVSQTGVDFEIIVVDDHSTDRTAEIAQSFPGVRLITAGPLPPGWTGKNNAVVTGARAARGAWLLFTDADTVHLPGSLARAIAEARANGADLLSYSPEQIAVTFWEMAVLPVVFAELARQYPPKRVSDPNSPAAAANGQYILIRRATYEAVGTHAVVADEILEDVALARVVKRSSRKIRFRYNADAVQTRMYRSFAQLREGWTKNLVLLFPRPRWIALKILGEWGLPWLLLSLVGFITPSHHGSLIAAAALLGARNFLRLRRANFDAVMEVLGVLFGMPMFAYLLLRSKRRHEKGTVAWKGRTYEPMKNSVTDNSKPNTHKALMNTTIVLLIPILFFTFLVHPFAGAAGAPPQVTGAPQFNNVIIEPGLSVGPLKLGDSQERALELFPKKAEDQEWTDPCGNSLDWVDTTNPNGRGDVIIRLKKGKIFQIESSTTRFRTADGITTFESPEKVASAYKGMSAGVLLTPPAAALGDRPLVFWIDKRRGIAFALAYDPSHRKRYVYKVIVFEPNKEFCPEQEKTTSSKWESIRPYSVEPPIELSPESQ
jgi:glycosyltransferase involved in cell wall biosynthesis